MRSLKIWRLPGHLFWHTLLTLELHEELHGPSLKLKEITVPIEIDPYLIGRPTYFASMFYTHKRLLDGY
jgi:hypothetical protein